MHKYYNIIINLLWLLFIKPLKRSERFINAQYFKNYMLVVHNYETQVYNLIKYINNY